MIRHAVCTWSPLIGFVAVGGLGMCTLIRMLHISIPCHAQGALSIIYILAVLCYELFYLISVLKFLDGYIHAGCVRFPRPSLTLFA